MITDSIENFYYKNGNYKYSVPIHQTWTIYKTNENKIYTKNKKGKLYSNDANLNKDSITNITINKSALKVLGFDCDELIIESPGSIQKYYYSSKLSIDPMFYKNHDYGNLNTITSITKSIPLKTLFIIENQGLILESIAIKINSRKIEDEIFLIPNDIELQEVKK